MNFADMEGAMDEADALLLTVRDNLAEVLSADRQYDETIQLHEIQHGRVADGRRTRRLAGAAPVKRIARNTWMGGDREAGEDLWTVLAEDCRRYL